MNRTLNYLNLVGVVLLAVLCALQWRRDSRLNLLAIDLEKTRQAQASKLAEQDAMLKQNASDLDDLRDRLERAAQRCAIPRTSSPRLPPRETSFVLKRINSNRH